MRLPLSQIHLSDEYIAAFREGIYFGYENITTQPACLEIPPSTLPGSTGLEGKYHQVKRMFGFFQNEVWALHRVSVGHFKGPGWGTVGC